jgi:hypothetical protein
MPILPKWSFHFPQTGYVLPDLAFLNTPSTPSVNGEINSSGFFAEIHVYENHTFEADNITQLTITNIGNNSVDLHFFVTEFMGGFEYLRDFRMFVMSQSKQVDILNFVNGLIRCNETVTLPESDNMLSFGVVVSGASRIVSNTTLTINLAIFHQDIAIKNVHLLLKMETYEN